MKHQTYTRDNPGSSNIQSNNRVIYWQIDVLQAQENTSVTALRHGRYLLSAHTQNDGWCQEHRKQQNSLFCLFHAVKSGKSHRGSSASRYYIQTHMKKLYVIRSHDLSNIWRSVNDTPLGFHNLFQQTSSLSLRACSRSLIFTGWKMTVRKKK